jgi:Transposase
MIGLDTAKSVFQVHAVNETGKAEIKRKLRRSELLPFFEKQGVCTVVLEACDAAHHWARMLTELGHDVKLIAPEAVKPFVKKGRKNDAADAAALCAAAARPDVKFVPAKSLEQQGILALHSARSLLEYDQHFHRYDPAFMRGDARRHAGNTPIEHSASGSITMMQSTISRVFIAAPALLRLQTQMIRRVFAVCM